MTIISNMDTESRPIKWLIDEFRNGQLTIDESFQRKFVWIRKDRISLIETILLGYPIPEIYLWETGTDPDSGATSYSIVDGQQRIRTIGDFIGNQLKLTDSGLEFKSLAYRGKLFEALSPDLKSAFWSYKVSIRFVKKSVPKADIVKMFLRLNSTSNALNPQELRNAEFHGAFLKTSEEVAAIPTWAEHIIFSENEIRRMQDIQFASTLLIFVRRGFSDETTQQAVNRMYDLYNESYPKKAVDVAEITAAVKFIGKLIKKRPSLVHNLRKKTHLYTVFTLICALLRVEPLDEAVIAKKLGQWFSWVDGNTQAPAEIMENVDSYRRLSQEGVQKKANRFERYRLVEQFIKS